MRSAPALNRRSAARRWARGTGVPEPLGDLLLVDFRRQELFQSIQHAEGGSVPDLLYTGASGYQEASNVPAAVADRVVEWRPDRSARCLEIGAALDQRQRNIDVIAACCPMKWSLSVLVVVASSVRISSGVNQQRDDRRPIRKVPGPVRDDVKQRTSSGDPGKPRPGKPRFCLEQTCQNSDITIVNRCDDSNRIAVADHDAQAIRLIRPVSAALGMARAMSFLAHRFAVIADLWH